MLTAYLISQVLTYTYTYTFRVSSKHIAYCLPHFLGKQYAICLLLTSKVYVYVSSKHAYLRYPLVSLLPMGLNIHYGSWTPSLK